MYASLVLPPAGCSGYSSSSNTPMSKGIETLIIVTTNKGQSYARQIGARASGLREDLELVLLKCDDLHRFALAEDVADPSSTLVHARCASPTAGWMASLRRFQGLGYRVINTPQTLALTSDKPRCAELMCESGLPHPASITIDTRNSRDDILGRIGEFMRTHGSLVVKPRVSVAQGAHVRRFSGPGARRLDEVVSVVLEQPTRYVCVQEYVEYRAIYRVIVIGGKALPYSWLDRPTSDSWKVSVCLNPDMTFVPRIDGELAGVAVAAQRVVGGEINFIDVFETRAGWVISEINTACNLELHQRLARRGGARSWDIARLIAEHLCAAFDAREAGSAITARTDIRA
ncbi:MAG: hypothetical protein HC927_07095 [Deltaproteobacteria bacterium]|nr:hypothetical protein [Deltaproteobacteria bacterium]